MVAGGWWLVAGEWWVVSGEWWLVAGGWWGGRSVVCLEEYRIWMECRSETFFQVFLIAHWS